jgi:ribulose-phosphate 3-epimerase
MTVNPGYSGQSFMPEVVPKIGRIRGILDEINPEAMIEVDGGINSETIRQTYEQGARIFVAASAIFNHPQGIKEGIQSLQNALA